MWRILPFVLILAACQGGVDSITAQARSDHAVPPQPATGEGCAGIHGNPPMSTEPSLQGQLADAWPVEQFCPLRGAQLLDWTDPDGTPRRACLHVPESMPDPAPLLVFLGGSLFPGDIQTPYNLYEFTNGTAVLGEDPQQPGFLLLMIDGRDKAHHYPFPDDTAWGFDHWYRNFDRQDPALNVDVATIDHFIARVREDHAVDARRIYLSGWSNGASTAILYGLNTPGIAAVAAYSSPHPYSDLLDPCAQPPFGDNFLPVMTVHNHCDIAGICLTGAEGFAAEMAQHMPQVEYRSVIINELQQQVAACDRSCSYSGDPMELATPGAPRHLLWPYQWSGSLFAFLRERPLPEPAATP